VRLGIVWLNATLKPRFYLSFCEVPGMSSWILRTIAQDACAVLLDGMIETGR